MLGTGLQFTRGSGRGEDRFYSATKGRSAYQNQRNDQLRRAQSDVTPAKSTMLKGKPTVLPDRVPENRAGCEESPKPVAVEPVEPDESSPLSNLDLFLESITPSVPAQYLPKRTTLRGCRTCDVELQPYFMLGDLWESFKEWSAYGAGVPLILNASDSVVQYYVPYLSAIQIYGKSAKTCVKSSHSQEFVASFVGQLGEDSDSDYRDSSSDGSSDYEPERGLKFSRELWNHHHITNEFPLGMERLSLRDQQMVYQERFSSDEGEFMNSQGCLLFEFLEQDPPYSREPLADKISDLAFRFPELKTLRSCDLLSSSWISVAWYPIYRIPTGPTLKDLDACFLTYHSLHTPVRVARSVQAPRVTYLSEVNGVPKMSLLVFGLASYKFKGSLWTTNGGCERHSANSLLQAAEDWLRLLQVNHPDFLFFCRR